MSARLNNVAALIFLAFGALFISWTVNLWYSLDPERATIPMGLAFLMFFAAAASYKDARS